MRVWKTVPELIDVFLVHMKSTTEVCAQVNGECGYYPKESSTC